MEEKTLVEAIADDLKAKRPLADIRKEYLDKDYPRIVIENAIEEAHQSIDPGKKHFDLTEHEDHEPGKKKENKDDKNVNVLPLIVIILIIWLGIMVSFYLAQPFGQAVSKLTLQKDTGFTPFCTEELQRQGNYIQSEIKQYCSIGQTAINSRKTAETDLRSGCYTLSYRTQEVESCVSMMKSLIDLYSSSPHTTASS